MRDRIEAAIKDAYYHARDNGGTMHTAATDATDAVLAVLAAPDEATIERLAEEHYRRKWRRRSYVDWSEEPEATRDIYRRAARDILAALAGTSAQARRTADDAADGGEDG